MAEAQLGVDGTRPHLECELLAWKRFACQAEERLAVFDLIEGWYNP